MKLYQYHHCPYCVRADMVANYKNVRVEKVYLLNDDEQSCYDLIKVKMVPILQFDDGSAMGESLDIVAKLDALGDSSKIITAEVKAESYNAVMATVSDAVRRLVYPRNILIGLPEFATQSARDYFQHKKQAMLGMSFTEAMAQTANDLPRVNQALSLLPEFTLSSTLSMDDILVFPTLRNLTMVKGLEFPQQVRRYLEHIAELTQSELYFSKAL